ncbi:MAG: hypothetical protein JWN79_2981 [Gemmatimonadetes bacterium]|jgi:hypothetical protein|nr:hypothetical protein [Gemmatimonadota bacterium]
MAAPAPGAPAWPVPATLSVPRALAARPSSVSALSWELLALHAEDAQRRASIAHAPLRVVVQSVVRELRAAGESWEGIYAALHAAVVPVPGRPVNWAAEYEMHTSRSAALVAHMHSWADVERLAELESEGG